MASTINAKTTGVGGIDASGDASGVLALQTVGVTGLTIDASQKVTFANSLTSPTLVTPVLGTPSSGTLTNCTFPTLNQNTTGSSASCTGNSATATSLSTIVGSAPSYACRAWIYFDGSIATPSIKGSGNISSITDNGTGDYTLNFTTAMSDVNYAYNITNDSGGSNSVRYSCTTTISAGSLRFTTRWLSVIGSGLVEDQNYVRVSIFR